MKQFICICLVAVMLASCQSGKRSKVIYDSPIAIGMRLNEIDMQLSEENLLKLETFLLKNDSLAADALSQGHSLDEIAEWYYPSVDTLALLLPPLERNDFILASKGRSGINNERAYTSELRRYIQYRKELALTSEQLEYLLVQCDSVEYVARSKRDKVQEMERKVLTSMLNSEQMKKFYIQKNETAAARETEDMLKQMKEKNLYTSVSDSITIYNQLYAYKLEQKANWEYLRYVEATMDSIRQNEARLWAYRPLPMIRLETCAPSFNNKMLDIVCKRKKLGLPVYIVDALLTSYSNLLQEEYRHKYEMYVPNKEFSRKEQENRCICQIVPSSFLDEYFKIIINDNVKKQVEKDWNVLLDYELVKSADSVKVMKELSNYETRLAIANQWIGVDKSRKNQFTKSDIINGKPQLLKQLDIEKRKRKNEKIVKF